MRPNNDKGRTSTNKICRRIENSTRKYKIKKEMEKKRKVIHCRFRKLQPAPCLSNGETRDTEHVLPTQTRSEPWYVLTEPRLGAHARLDQLATVFLAFHSPALGSTQAGCGKSRRSPYILSAFGNKDCSSRQART